MKFVRNFKKIVYGHVTVEATDIDDVQQEFDEANYEEYDNKSDYEWEDWECIVEDPAFDGRRPE